MRRLAVVLVVLGLGLSASAVAGKVLPTFPTCGAFSTSKVSRLVRVGKLYLSSTLVHRTSCIYYGVNRAQATNLATMGVSYTKIRYYPALMIAVTPATKFLFGLQLDLIKQTVSKDDLEFAAVNKKLRFTSDEYFYAGQIGGANQMKCDPQIQYDNWAGPPECDGEPALTKVGVIAFIPTNGNHGRLLTITATQQAPGSLSLSHVLELARQTLTGQLY
jgi:hypothetical protein